MLILWNTELEDNEGMSQGQFMDENPNPAEELNVENEFPTCDGETADSSKGTKDKRIDSLIHLLNDNEVIEQIEYVANNFGRLSEFIKKVEAEVLPTIDFIEMLQKLYNDLVGITDLKPEIKDHLDRVIMRNQGFLHIQSFFACKWMTLLFHCAYKLFYNNIFHELFINWFHLYHCIIQFWLKINTLMMTVFPMMMKIFPKVLVNPTPFVIGRQKRDDCL